MAFLKKYRRKKMKMSKGTLFSLLITILIGLLFVFFTFQPILPIWAQYLIQVMIDLNFGTLCYIMGYNHGSFAKRAEKEWIELQLREISKKEKDLEQENNND